MAKKKMEYQKRCANRRCNRPLYNQFTGEGENEGMCCINTHCPLNGLVQVLTREAIADGAEMAPWVERAMEELRKAPYAPRAYADSARGIGRRYAMVNQDATIKMVGAVMDLKNKTRQLAGELSNEDRAKCITELKIDRELHRHGR